MMHLQSLFNCWALFILTTQHRENIKLDQRCEHISCTCKPVVWHSLPTVLPGLSSRLEPAAHWGSVQFLWSLFSPPCLRCRDGLLSAPCTDSSTAPWKSLDRRTSGSSPPSLAAGRAADQSPEHPTTQRKQEDSEKWKDQRRPMKIQCKRNKRI